MLSIYWETQLTRNPSPTIECLLVNLITVNLKYTRDHIKPLDSTITRDSTTYSRVGVI